MANEISIQAALSLQRDVLAVQASGTKPNPTLATGRVAKMQVVWDQVVSCKGLPYICSSCLALSRGGDCWGRVNFNCSSRSFWSVSGWV